MAIESLLPWKWLKLDPKRTQLARSHFDVVGKYDKWHDYSRRHLVRKVECTGSKLDTDGFQIFRLLTSIEALEAKQLLLREAGAFVAKKNINYADVLQFRSTAFFKPILDKMLNPDVDAVVSFIFGSEYYVHSLVANRTMPSKASKRSFLWHCDRGPRNFLKINMFLDATSSHGGTTEFVDLETSLEIEKMGYTFGANARRVADLAPLSRKLDRSVKVLHPQLESGEAFIFYPARALHRGYLPTHGIRHMISIVLLPSPVHWTVAWEKTVASGYHERTFAAFPDEAESIFGELGLERSAL